jgi:hypothetical protein
VKRVLLCFGRSASPSSATVKSAAEMWDAPVINSFLEHFSDADREKFTASDMHRHLIRSRITASTAPRR